MRLSFIASATLVALPLTAQSPTIAARADSMLRDAERRGFSGSVLITIDGRPALLKGYGLAERATARRFTPATVVQIGSNTKDFTTVAILQLVDAGKLSLDDSLPTIWQGVPADKRGITVRMLLTHRAGFAGHADPIAGDFAPVTRPQMVDRALARALAFRPGTREQYSNEGYSLLAAIIELRRGESFDQYVQQRILAPIGLTRTGFHLPAFATSDLAHGYTREGRDNGTMLSRPHASDGPFWNLRGNGGMLSTLEEMQRFYTALYGDKLVGRALRAEFFPDQPTALAGSDNVSFFGFAHEPGLKLDLLLASTNAAVPGPSVFRPLIQMITGRRGPDGEDAPPATARAVS
ncbi:MAG: beta-lactamase family protein, partial [Gemmatimonadaceae bacterium]|nr:beta-lactamase family protein [Gemmatimonadaceae bacterium]